MRRLINMSDVEQKRSLRQKSKIFVLIVFGINFILFLMAFFERMLLDSSDQLWYLQALEAGISCIYVFNILNPRDWLIYLLIAYWLK